MIALSVDPATHGCGLALWNGGELYAAGYAPNKYKGKDTVRRCVGSAVAVTNWLAQYDVQLDMVNKLVFELPQIYQRGGGKTKGDPNKTVLPLAMVDASLATLMDKADVQTFQPHDWKGTTQKPKNTKESEYVIIGRVKERLTEQERDAINWTESVQHSWDVADAIGVGLRSLGRFDRVRVFARE